eukprot:COSAG06_NODE_3591_length_5143_cov_3.495440_9_plen_57_part_00
MPSFDCMQIRVADSQSRTPGWVSCILSTPPSEQPLQSIASGDPFCFRQGSLWTQDR